MKKSKPLFSVTLDWFGYAASMLIIFFTYSKISAFWVDIGGINTDPFDYQILLLELPLIVVVSLVFFCKRASGFLFKFILPFFPVLSFYIIFDIFYTFLKRSPHPSDLRNINTVMDFSPFVGYLSISVFIVILFLSAFFLHSKIENEYSVKSFSLSIIKRISILLCMFSVFFCSSGMDFFVEKFNYIDWSHERTIRSNGRMASFIYYGLQEKKNRETLNNFLKDEKSNDMSIYDMLYPDFHLKKEKKQRDVHLIVLESFLDPRLIKDAKFNISPLSPELKPFLFKDEKFSLVKSPVYGGRTAQAEFELLTGIPALAKVDSVEFNVMMGNKASSFVQRLKSVGYESMATVASTSCYFNAKQAYRSIGFNNLTFLKELDEFDSEKDYLPIFDGEVFEYNLKKVKKFREKSSRPLFNYVIGMYGHFPYETVSEEHSDVVQVAHEDERIHKIANQFFYRTKALAEYIRQLQEIDPDSIICVVSDHLPPILWDGTQYQLEQEMNIAILIDKKQTVDTEGMAYYKLPWFIWGRLFDREYTVDIDEKMTENIYFKFLSESMF